MALTALTPHLPAGQQPAALAQALDIATAISEEFPRAQALHRLVSHLPPGLLAQAIAATPRTFGQTAVAILTRGRSVLPSTDRETLFDLLRSSLSGADRRSCLAIVSAMAPFIAQIGGENAIRVCIRAIADAYRWWP